MKNQKNNFDDSIHHMEMACLMNDTMYLRNEIIQLANSVNLGHLTQDEFSKLKNVSMEAAMEGNVKCLECLFSMNIPLDELCPVIAACHGHKNVIEFCVGKGMDCSDAWNRYFSWILMNQDNARVEEDTSIVLASEWIKGYNKQPMKVAN